MSDPADLRALAFAGADGSLWGAAVDHGARALVSGAGATGAGLAEGLEWTEDGDDWRLTGDGVSLTVTPLAPPVGEEPPPGAPYVGEGPELCRVHGRLPVVDGEVDVIGTRVVIPAPAARDAPVSARLVGAFLPDGGAVGLIAVRPRRAEHADGDVLAATVFEPAGWVAVADPRLSTTYDGSGAAVRCNLELWIADGENEFPRRAAGEVNGAAGAASARGLTLEVAPLHAHSRGEDGAGVYATATFG